MNSTCFSPVLVTFLIIVCNVGKETNRLKWTECKNLFFFRVHPIARGNLFLMRHCYKNLGNGAVALPRHNSVFLPIDVSKLFLDE